MLIDLYLIIKEQNIIVCVYYKGSEYYILMRFFLEMYLSCFFCFQVFDDCLKYYFGDDIIILVNEFIS